MAKLVDIKDAQVGDFVDPTTLPLSITKQGGGWTHDKYVSRGAHKDGQYGFKCLQIGQPEHLKP